MASISAMAGASTLPFLSPPGLSGWSRFLKLCLPERDGRDKPGHDDVEARSLREFPDAMMANKDCNSRSAVLDPVVLLADVPAEGLARGQVGTVVERLDDATMLVEFSDDEGRAYAVVPCPRVDLLVLHYVPEAVA